MFAYAIQTFAFPTEFTASHRSKQMEFMHTRRYKYTSTHWKIPFNQTTIQFICTNEVNNQFEWIWNFNPMNCSQCLIEWVLLTDDWSWNGNKNRIRRNFVHKITVNCEIKQFKVLKNKGMIQKLEPQFPLIIIFFCVTIIISCFPILSV